MLLTTHEGSKALRNLYVDAQNIVYLLLELSRVSCLAEHSNLASLQSVLQSLISACSVRIKDIPRILVALAHSSLNLLVAVSCTAYERCDLSVTLAVQVVDTCKVRRIAHVHCISQSLL